MCTAEKEYENKRQEKAKHKHYTKKNSREKERWSDNAPSFSLAACHVERSGRIEKNSKTGALDTSQ